MIESVEGTVVQILDVLCSGKGEEGRFWLLLKGNMNISQYSELIVCVCVCVYVHQREELNSFEGNKEGNSGKERNKDVIPETRECLT